MKLPDSWRDARVTVAVAVAMATAWLIPTLFGFEGAAAVWGGFVPARANGLVLDQATAPFLLTPITASFLHASLIHLGFNLVLLLLCGRVTETIIGPGGMFILCLLGAYAACAAQYAAGPGDVLLYIGASGVTSAVLGAYAMLVGKVKVKIANPTLARWLNALWLVVAWVGLQALIGLTARSAGVGIGIAAHIGGFILGLLLAKPLLMLKWRGA